MYLDSYILETGGLNTAEFFKVGTTDVLQIVL